MAARPAARRLAAVVVAVAAGFRPSPRAPRASALLRRASEDDTEWDRFSEFNRGTWRGRCRSICVDAKRRTADLDAQLDGRRYTSTVRTSRSGVDEELLWDDAAGAASFKAGAKTLVNDFDGSYSADFAAHNFVEAAAPCWAAEAGLAVADDERVRVHASYDGGGSLVRVAYLDEVRVGSAAKVEGAAVADHVSDVFALAGEWRGDATLRKPGVGCVNVLKQDLALQTDGDRLFRSLTVYDAACAQVQKLESFGDVTFPTKGGDFEFVVFRDTDTVLCLLSGMFVLAPLSISDDEPFFIESGIFVEEAQEDAQANGGQQLPISVRGDADDADLVVSDSSRFLSRSVRLYAKDRSLHSVTTSYHQLYDCFAE